MNNQNSDWQQIENTIRQELSNNYFIDDLQVWLTQHNNEVVTKQELSNIIVKSLGTPREINQNDVDVILDYLEIFEIISFDTNNTYFVSIPSSSRAIDNDENDYSFGKSNGIVLSKKTESLLRSFVKKLLK